MRRILLVGGLLLSAACAPQHDANKDWDAFRDRFIEGILRDQPGFAVAQGRHEYDGKLRDLSEAGLAHSAAFLKAAKDTALAFDPATLDSTRRFERDYLAAVVDGQLFWQVSADGPHKNPDWYTSELDPQVYLTRPYAPIADRLKAYIAWAKRIPAATAAIQANLRPPLPRPIIDIGRIRFGGLADYLTTDVPQIFADVKDTALRAQFRDANASAAKAFAALDTWLEAQRKTQTEDFALGAAKFAEMLHATERVDVPLDTLLALGRADLARNVAALKDACAQFAPGKSIPDCVRKEAAHKPDGGPVAEGRRQLVLLEAFVRSKDIVSIPDTQHAQVMPSPPYQQSNSAFIDVPGPYEKGMPSVYYISPPNPKWTKAEQDGYIPGVADLLFTSVHEVWPGHFLQFLHANHSPSMLGRLFVGYAYAEGWAHYCEEMMWEEGLGNGDAETHVGQLINATLRDARFISAIGMHTGKMTTAESEKLFHEEAFQDAATSREQAERGTYDPAYLNYTLGKLMIRKLRDDWTATRGGKTAWKAFHDAFLSYGGPPIPLVRQAMLGAKAGPAL